MITSDPKERFLTKVVLVLLKEKLLLSQLEEVQQRLNSLLESAGEQGQSEVILPQEVQVEIEKFREEERQTRRKLREVRKILRQDIERLGEGLLLSLSLIKIRRFRRYSICR